MTPALFLHQVIDASSRVVPGATATFMQGFRKGDIFHDPEMRTPAMNPHKTDGAGRLRLYLIAGETYEVTIETPKGDRYQFNHVARAEGQTVRETVEVIREVHVPDPEADALRKRIAELEAAASAEPEPAEPVPEQLADIILPAETPSETHARLTTLYGQAKNAAEMARSYGGTFGGKSVIEWERKAEHYESGLKWNRGRMAEVI